MASMRAETELKLNAVWYGQRKPPFWLKLLVPLYSAGRRLDHWWKTRQVPDDLDDRGDRARRDRCRTP